MAKPDVQEKAYNVQCEISSGLYLLKQELDFVPFNVEKMSIPEGNISSITS